MLNYLNLFNKNNLSKKITTYENLTFDDNNIKLNNIDYYYSNVIARSSKTMFDCRNEKINVMPTGTEG